MAIAFFLPLLFSGGALAVVYPDWETASNLVCNTSASVHDRASALVDALALEEIVDNMVHVAPGIPRLSLPPYTWLNEALVSGRMVCNSTFFSLTGILTLRLSSFCLL